MTQEAIVQQLTNRFSSEALSYVKSAAQNASRAKTESYLVIDRASIRELCFFLRDDEALQFDTLLLLSSLDNGDGTLTIVYHLESRLFFHQLTLKVTVPTADAKIDSVTDIWAHANWHEREAWDMMGIRFSGHPDHRRILLDDDYPGHPLRKNFKEPDFYHGMIVPSKPHA